MTINTDAAGYSQGTTTGITVNGIAVTDFKDNDNGNNSYTVKYTVSEGHTNIEEDATIPISVELCNSDECNTPYVTPPAAEYSPAIDAQKPTLTEVTIVSNNVDPARAKVGDELTVSFTASDELGVYPTATIGVGEAIVDSDGGNDYTAIYTMQEGDSEGIVPFTIDFEDKAGNAGTQVTASTNHSEISFDKTPPRYVAGVYLSDNEIKLFFSEELKDDTDHASEFEISGGSISVDTAKIQADKTDVKLTLTGGDSSADATVSTIETTLTDLAGNKLVDLENEPVPANAAPGADNVNIFPSSPKTVDELICNYTYSDAESDKNGTAAFLWFKNGGPTGNIGQTLAPSNTNSGESWICQVTPTAATGTSPGEDANSLPVTISTISTPTISSSSHPEDTWKKSEDPSFTWNSVSGATYYYVFDTSSSTTPDADDSSTDSTSKPYSNVSNGTHYFHLRAKVGSEWSSTDHYRIKVDDEDPETPTSLRASYDSDDEEVRLTWGESEDDYSGVDHYCLYRERVTDVDDMDRVTCSLDGDEEEYYDDVSDLSEGLTYYYRLVAVDVAGNESDESDYVSIKLEEGATGGGDTRPPYLAWETPGNNAEVSGVVQLKVRSYDDESAMFPVYFYIDNNVTPLAIDGSPLDQRYVQDWDSRTVPDGAHTLKAVAKNRSGSSNDNITKTISIVVDNGTGPEPSGDEEEALKAINEADDAKEEAAGLFAQLEALNCDAGQDAVALLSDGSGILDEAQELFDDGEFGDAKEKAEEAKAKLVEIKGLLSVSGFGQALDYLFNPEHLNILLQGLGLSQEHCDMAAGLLDTHVVDRQLAVKEVNDGDSVFYKAVVTIKVRNDSDSDESIKVVEVIPKELAENADEIESGGYTVLLQDPVIEWSVSLNAGEEKEISYVLGKEMTQEEATQLLESGVVNQFKAPPILLPSETELSESEFAGAGAAGFFALGNLLGMAGWAVVIIVVIAAAVLAFNYVQNHESKPGRGIEGGLGYSGEKKGIGSGLFGRGGSREEEHKPRWGYRE